MKWLLFLILLLPGSAPEAKVRLTTLFIIPTADILDHRQWRVSGQGNFFAYQDSAGATPKLWTVPLGGADLGLSKRLEFGLKYAGGPSLQFKGFLHDDEPDNYLPSIALGARDIMTSAEAGYFGVRDKDTLADMSNQAYLALGKSIDALGLRIHTGIMTNYGIKSDRFAPFIGLEAYIGGGFYAGYEAFKRFGGFPQFLNFSYRYGDNFIINLGLSELREVFYHDGKAGFRVFAKDDVLPTGYGSPGLNFSIAFTGFLPAREGEGPRVEDKVAEIEKSLIEIKGILKEMGTRIERSDRQLTSLQEGFINLSSPPIGITGRDPKVEIPEHLKAIVALLESGAAYDPEEVSLHVRKIANFKQLALPALSRILRDPTVNPKLTSLAIQTIGEIGAKSSKQVLLTLLDYKESGIKIDALIALGKLRDMTIAVELERALYDTDPAVATTAQQVIGSLTGEMPELPKPKLPAPANDSLTTSPKKTPR